MKQKLVVYALGSYQSHILQKLTRSIRDSGAEIIDCRQDILGNETSVTFLLSGSWDAVAKLEGVLTKLEKDLGIHIHSKRTEKRVPDQQRIPYSFEIFGADSNHILNDTAAFMMENNLNICECYTNTYQNPHTDTTLLSIHMTVNIPTDISISTIRSEFIEFCDRLNLDAIMEPVKSL